MASDRHLGLREELHKQDFIERYHKSLRKRLDTVFSLGKQRREEEMPSIGREFLKAVVRGNPRTVEVFIEEGMNVNYQDPKSGETALHAAAGARARQSVRVLLATGDCNYLLRDRQGRLPSELAYLAGDDPALARLLGNKERKQARAQGIKLTRRP